jgi:uncharacterized protein
MKECVLTFICVLLLHAGAGAAQRAGSRPGRRPQSVEEIRSPLMRAAAGGRAAAVRRLLKKGADVDERDAVGVTALMLAAKSGRLEVVKVLLAAGADPNAAGGVAHGGVFSVLTLALNRGNGNWQEVFDTLVAAGAKVNPPGNHPASPLEEAISQRDVGMIKAMLARGADVNRKNGVGHTPLVAAIAVAEPEVEVVKVLLGAGADPNLPRLSVGDERISLLAYVEGWLKASKDEAREEIARLLRRAGAK